LGFLINSPKSSLVPLQDNVFLGFRINSRTGKLSLPPEKVTSLKNELKKMLQVNLVSARSLAQLIRRMTATTLAVCPAPLHYHSLKDLKHGALKKRGYDAVMTIPQKARQDMHWWLKNLTAWNGHPARDSDSHLVFEMDGSKRVWRAHPVKEH